MIRLLWAFAFHSQSFGSDVFAAFLPNGADDNGIGVIMLQKVGMVQNVAYGPSRPR
jgi:hypothetical protein